MPAHTVAKGLCSWPERCSCDEGKDQSRSIWKQASVVSTPLESRHTPFLTLLRGNALPYTVSPPLKHPALCHSASHLGRPLNAEGCSSYVGVRIRLWNTDIRSAENVLTWVERMTATTRTTTVVFVPNPLEGDAPRAEVLLAEDEPILHFVRRGLFAMSVVNPNPARMHPPLLATKYPYVRDIDGRPQDGRPGTCKAPRSTSSRQAEQLTIVRPLRHRYLVIALEDAIRTTTGKGEGTSPTTSLPPIRASFATHRHPHRSLIRVYAEADDSGYAQEHMRGERTRTIHHNFTHAAIGAICCLLGTSARTIRPNRIAYASSSVVEARSKTGPSWRCDHTRMTQLESYRHDSMPSRYCGGCLWFHAKET
ncbi:hypothetical protein C8F01DRAFT_1365597, partial [Mycena amicta]